MRTRNPNRTDQRDEFRKKVDSWAMRLRVNPKQVRIQRMTRKWASWSTSGRVTFAKDLLNKPSLFVDYVIVHELLHFRVPNHGKLFKSMLAAHVPGWRNIMHLNATRNDGASRRGGCIRVEAKEATAAAG